MHNQVLLASCALMLALFGCKAPPEVARDQFPLPEDVEIVEDIEPGQYGGIFILTEISQPTTFNRYVPSNLSTVTIQDRIFDALVNYNPMREEIVPGLASSWEVAEDQRTYTFNLRKGIKWSDGAPFSADDVLFTFEVLMADEADPKTGETKPYYPTRYYSQLQFDGEKLKVEKVDDHTVRFVTPKVYAPFLYDLMDLHILPKHKLQASHDSRDFFRTWTTETAINNPSEIVGTGRFVIETFRPGERLVLRPNPHYWKADVNGNRLPYIDRLIYKFVAESNTEVVYFATGQTSVGGVGPADVSWVREQEKTYDFTLYKRGPSTYVTMIWLNLNPGKSPEGQPYVEPKKLKWFQDKRFRQALYYGFNREAVIEAVFFGRGQPLDSIIPPAQGKWHNSDIKKYRYNPEKARALLKDAGFTWDKDGRLQDKEGNEVEFNLMLPTGGSWMELIVTFKENLDALGIRLNLDPVDFTTMIRKIDNSFDYDASVIGWGSNSAAYDPSGSKALYLSEGIYHMWHPRQKSPATEWEARIDKLYREQESTLDMQKRIANMHEIQNIFAEEVPLIFLASVEGYAGVQNKWKNIKLPPAGSIIWNIEEIFTDQPATE